MMTGVADVAAAHAGGARHMVTGDGPPVAVVTGGAGAIGSATCRCLACAGMLPVLVDRDADRLRDCAATLERELGTAPGTLVVDLTAAGAATRVMAEVAATWGRLDTGEVLHVAGGAQLAGRPQSVDLPAGRA